MHVKPVFVKTISYLKLEENDQFFVKVDQRHPIFSISQNLANY